MSKQHKIRPQLYGISATMNYYGTIHSPAFYAQTEPDTGVHLIVREDIISNTEVKRFRLVNKLLNDFNSDKASYKHLVNDNQDRAFSIVAYDFISALDANFIQETQITTSLTDSPSIIFTVRNYKSDFRLRYEVFTEDNELYVAYSIYQSKQLKLRNAGNHYDMIEEVKSFFGLPTLSRMTKIVSDQLEPNTHSELEVLSF
ncbi:MAG: hypothetical protein AAF693_03110 [Bacteroidota bacterium]